MTDIPLRESSFNASIDHTDSKDSEWITRELQSRIIYKAKIKSADPDHIDRYLVDIYINGYENTASYVDIPAYVVNPDEKYATPFGQEVNVNLMPDLTAFIVSTFVPGGDRFKVMDSIASGGTAVVVRVRKFLKGSVADTETVDLYMLCTSGHGSGESVYAIYIGNGTGLLGPDSKAVGLLEVWALPVQFGSANKHTIPQSVDDIGHVGYGPGRHAF